MSRICSNCGAEMQDDQAFCVTCGTKYVEPAADKPAEAPKKAPRAKKPKNEATAAPAAESKLPAPESKNELPLPVSATEVVAEPAKPAKPARAAKSPKAAKAAKPEPVETEPAKPESLPEEPVAEQAPAEPVITEPAPQPQAVEPVKPVEPPRTPVATIPVPAPQVAVVAPVTVATGKNQDVPNSVPKQYRPLRTSSFMLLMLLFSLPVVGLIALIICAIPKSFNRNTRNMARAYLWWMLVSLLVLVIVALLGYFLFWPTYGPQIVEFFNQLQFMV